MDFKLLAVVCVVALAAVCQRSVAIPVGAAITPAERAAILRQITHMVSSSNALPKRANAELINGLLGMNLGQLNKAGKRANAELINGLLGMNLGQLNKAGKRSNAELINGLLGMDLSKLNAVGK